MNILPRTSQNLRPVHEYRSIKIQDKIHKKCKENLDKNMYQNAQTLTYTQTRQNKMVQGMKYAPERNIS